MIAMRYDSGRQTLDYYVNPAIVHWQTLWGRLTRFATSRPRLVILTMMLGLLIVALGLRFAHLLYHDHYFILSNDSYFFHWVARRVMAGEGPPAGAPSGLFTINSGLVYPIVYLAKAASFLFNLSTDDALGLICKLLPPLIGAGSLVAVYIVGSKMFSKKVGLWAALAWAVIPYSIMFGAAGYIDRDGLNILLVMLGASIFYLSKNWRLRLANRRVDWIAAGLAVLAIEVMLYVEWYKTLGPLILLSILAFYCVVRFIVAYMDCLATEPSVARRLRYAAGTLNWRVLLVIILGNIIALGGVLILDPANVSSTLRTAIRVLGAGGEIDILEMEGISISELFSFQFWLIAIVLGFFVSWKRRSEAGVFVCSWVLFLLIGSLFAKRLLFFLIPPACWLSGTAIVFLWEWSKRGLYRYLKKALSVAVICLCLSSVWFAFIIGSNTVFSVHQEWEDALTYLREETPKDAMVMTEWNWGYWILDLGQRRPLVDPGYYLYDDRRLHDVGVTYITNKPSEAVQIMNKYGADYLVFARRDLTHAAPIILEWAGLSEEYDSFPADSLIVRSLAGDLVSEQGLEVVFRNDEVVILRATPET